MKQHGVLNMIEQSNFSRNFITYANNHVASDYQRRFNEPFQEDYFNNPMMNLDPQERLTESLAQLVCLKDYYIKKKIPLVYLYDSIYDLSYRLERYYKNHGVYGLSDRDIRWLTPLYRGKIFDLGSLRFEISFFSNKEIERIDYDYMPLSQKWKNKYPEGTPIITIHILKDTDFRPHKIDASFELAVGFFENYFPQHDYDVFVCRTWLLYGPTRKILGKDSNIVSFSNRFKIIAEHNNAKQALDRIYGTNDLTEIENMAKHSSLDKIAYKNIEKLGVATGVISKRTLM